MPGDDSDHGWIDLSEALAEKYLREDAPQTPK